MAQYIPHGIWTLGFALKDFGFVDKLSHTLAFAYSQGTDDSEVFEKMINGELDLFKGQRFQEMTDEDSSIAKKANIWFYFAGSWILYLLFPI